MSPKYNSFRLFEFGVKDVKSEEEAPEADEEDRIPDGEDDENFGRR